MSVHGKFKFSRTRKINKYKNYEDNKNLIPFLSTFCMSYEGDWALPICMTLSTYWRVGYMERYLSFICNNIR